MDLRFPCDYGGYRLTGLLGMGGSAEVFRAEVPGSTGTVTHVAIRRVARAIANDPDAQRVLLEEADLWVGLRHPNVVSVLDVGEHDGDWFLVLELVDGASADELLRVLGPMSVPESLCVAHHIALALSAAHELTLHGRRLEMVHRDVKPANILIGPDGVSKLTDFGIARTADRLGRTAAGIVKGSLHFLSPEQVRKDPLDARTDLFGLGCTLHTMLCFRPLIDLPKDALLRALARGEIPPPPETMPDGVRALLSTLTAADPAGRPRTARAAADLIAATLAPETSRSAERALAERIRKFKDAVTPSQDRSDDLSLGIPVPTPTDPAIKTR